MCIFSFQAVFSILALAVVRAEESAGDSKSVKKNEKRSYEGFGYGYGGLGLGHSTLGGLYAGHGLVGGHGPVVGHGLYGASYGAYPTSIHTTITKQVGQRIDSCKQGSCRNC